MPRPETYQGVFPIIIDSEGQHRPDIDPIYSWKVLEWHLDTMTCLVEYWIEPTEPEPII